MASLDGSLATQVAPDSMVDLMESLSVSQAPSLESGPLADLSSGPDVFADPVSLAKGGVVIIQGLQAKPEYNGERATLDRFDMQKQRVTGAVTAMMAYLCDIGLCSLLPDVWLDRAGHR